MVSIRVIRSDLAIEAWEFDTATLPALLVDAISGMLNSNHLRILISNDCRQSVSSPIFSSDEASGVEQVPLPNCLRRPQ